MEVYNAYTFPSPMAQRKLFGKMHAATTTAIPRRLEGFREAAKVKGKEE